MIRLRARLGHVFVRLASKIDNRPQIGYSVTHHMPQGWVSTEYRPLR